MRAESSAMTTRSGGCSTRTILPHPAPRRAAHSRVLLIELSLVFGAWLIAKALGAFGIS